MPDPSAPDTPLYRWLASGELTALLVIFACWVEIAAPAGIKAMLTIDPRSPAADLPALDGQPSATIHIITPGLPFSIIRVWPGADVAAVVPAPVRAASHPGPDDLTIELLPEPSPGTGDS
jgi:hypothetical protein